MMDPVLIGHLEHVYDLLARSFLRYAVEASGPVIGDDWDRRAMEALKVWVAADRGILGKVEEILAAHKFHPLAPVWSVQYSQYHFLSSFYLLGPVARKMEPQAALLEAEAAALALWPEAEALASQAAAHSCNHLTAVQALSLARPKEVPKPAPKKGVSASRW